MRIRVRMLKDVDSLKKGSEHNLQPGVANRVIRKGYAEKIGEAADLVMVKKKAPEAAAPEAAAPEAAAPEAAAPEAAAYTPGMDYNDMVKLLPEDYTGSKKKEAVIAFLELM